MRLFNKQKTGSGSVLSDRYVPAVLPSYGQGLENFVPSDYPMNQPETVAGCYRDAQAQLDGVIDTCDRHSTGSECDAYIDAQAAHAYAQHDAACAHNDNQIERIRSARKMRGESLERKIAPLQAQKERLEAEIEPLEGLNPQFQIRIGKFACSAGVPITIAAMIVDALVNHSFLESILLTNAGLLAITVACLSVMSDGSMWALGTFLSKRHEKFTSKPLFWTVCIGLASMFVLSVVASVMVRYGSMDATFGTVNAAGEFVGKESYSLAEYGVTLVTAFVTTATGLLSFAFSLDENAALVALRERKRKELAGVNALLDVYLCELSAIQNAPDPEIWDARKRTAAEKEIEATRKGLKLHCRKQMALKLGDADFTDKMADSGEQLLAGPAAERVLTPAHKVIKVS